MKVDKISISLEPALSDEVRAAAMKAGIGVSRWLAEAAAAKLRAEALADFLDVWQKEHGSITAQELTRAESELGLKKGDASIERARAGRRSPRGRRSQ